MSLALLIAGVLIVVVLMTRSARRAWKDHHSLRAHHKTLDALGEVAHHQDSAIAPVPDPALIRAHVRVVKPTESGPSGPPRPTRPQPTPPAVAAGLVAETIDAPILSRPLHRRRRPPPRPLAGRPPSPPAPRPLVGGRRHRHGRRHRGRGGGPGRDRSGPRRLGPRRRGPGGLGAAQLCLGMNGTATIDADSRWPRTSSSTGARSSTSADSNAESDAVAEHRREVAAGDLADDRPVDAHRVALPRWSPARDRQAPEAAQHAPGSARPSSAWRPRNPDGLSQATTHPRLAWSGVMPGPSSWPCSGNPASSRRVSRAPRPAGGTPASSTACQRPSAASRRHRELHAVLTGVAGPGGRAGRPPPFERGHPEAADGRRLRHDRRQPAPRRGPLHGDDGPAGGDVHPPDRLEHPGGVGRVRHHVEALLVQPPHDDVVGHRRVRLVEKVGVLGPPRPDLVEVVGEGGLQPVPGLGPFHPHRAQMADVEDHGRRGGRPDARRWCPRG